MAKSSRYRVVGFVGSRILENTELLRMQSISRGVNPSGNKVVYDLDQIYREGAVQNITASISGLTVTFSATNGAYPMAVFVRGRWETLSNLDLPSITLSSTQTHIYLNYALNIVTWDGGSGTITDATLVDSVSG